MSDEKKKPEEEEVSDEQLNDVTGGATASTAHQDINLAKQWDVATPTSMDSALGGNTIDPTNLDVVRSTDDEND